MRKVAVFSLLVVVAGLFAPPAPISDAQYGPPAGGTTASVDNPTPDTDSDVVVTCEVHDAAGAPLAGETCTFRIESEPGTDAALGSKVVSKTTDASGRATANLYTGTQPGVIVISATSGNFTSVVLVSVGVRSAPPPPAAPVSTITPPSTGDGGLLSAH